jgi:hypothetical protein
MSVSSINKFLSVSFRFLILTGLLLSCSKNNSASDRKPSADLAPFYSSGGVEQQVVFTAAIRTNDFKLANVPQLSQYQKTSFEKYTVKDLVSFLYGPLTRRELGGMRTDSKITVDWSSARQVGNTVELNFTYEGAWIISNTALYRKTIYNLPLPYDTSILYTDAWLKCTDSDPEHQTESFYWYFWDPARYGCDHQLGTHYQEIKIKLGERTYNQNLTFPNYSEMVKSAGIENNLQMTFAFGYVTDVEDSNPDRDNDYGMTEYRKFIRYMDKQAKKLKLTKTEITQSEYLNPLYPEKVIGHRYQGNKDGVNVDVKVVTSANIDQMELFAKSYAHDHDGFFAWFGHSRVGSGFDARNFKSLVDEYPEYYSISPQYQLVYWAGCNSYSYYTLPFFEHKANVNANDPKGTLGLDILSNGLPSLFSFNAYNAIATYNALINWETPTSYQAIVQDLEKYGRDNGVIVLVNVIGDEDNQ